MAMSKAFPGLRLPGEFKAQACGHTFRATQTLTSCPHCRAVIRARATAPAPSADVLVLKAAKALREASGGALTLAQARDRVADLLQAA